MLRQGQLFIFFLKPTAIGFLNTSTNFSLFLFWIEFIISRKKNGFCYSVVKYKTDDGTLDV